MKTAYSTYRSRYFFSLFIFSFLSLLSWSVISSKADSTPKPSAEAILAAAREVPTHALLRLEGSLRERNTVIPLNISLQGTDITYQLHDPEEKIALNLTPEKSSLSTTSSNSSSQATNRYQKIRNTSITYDDLALGFLYWPHPQVTGEEKLRGQPCWVITLQAPNKAAFSDLATARLWIDKNNGALLRMEGSNKECSVIKRLEILSAQKINGYWTLKQMRLELLDPKTNHVIERLYLTLHKA